MNEVSLSTYFLYLHIMILTRRQIARSALHGHLCAPWRVQPHIHDIAAAVEAPTPQTGAVPKKKKSGKK